MNIEITVPAMGESVSSGVIAAWLKADGDSVAEGEELFELETDKATVSVPSTATGVLTRKSAEGDEVAVGELVALIDTGVASRDAAPTGAPAPAAAKLSPAARRIVEQYRLDYATLRGSGANGIVTKEDALAALLAKAEGELARAASRADAAGRAAAGAAAGAAAAVSKDRAASASSKPRQERRPMSNIRKRIAENLVESQRTSAHLTTFNEVDMSAVMAMRQTHRDAFEKRHGVRLGFMSFFVKAACAALEAYPQANSAIDGDDIIINNYFNIGVAVSTERGLLVPVIRDADTKSFAGIESEIISFALRAKEKKIGVDELSGGTFSITNGGVFGSLLSTPIPTPGQSAILGMHAIQRRPVAIGDSVEIRPMMYLAVTYDHRIMDGREAVGFLVRIKELVEDPGRVLLSM